MLDANNVLSGANMLGPHMSKLLMTLKIVTGQKVMTVKCVCGFTLDPSWTVGSKSLTAGSIGGETEVK